MTFDPMRTKTYCVIEDIPDVRDRLQKEMNAWPDWHCVGSSDSVRMAKKMIEENRPHLIFCDWDLVGGSGFEVLQHIQQIKDYAPFIIFNTGFQADHPEIAEELINTYKVDAFINKPYWQKLLEQLPQLLQQATDKINRPADQKLWWLRLANGERQRINLDAMVAIVQCPENPRNKLVYLHQNPEPLACTLTWPEAAELFERAGLQAFAINKRYAIIGKKYIQRYQAPYVWVGNPPLKLEVVKETLRDFEKWVQL
ncbi:MAG: response regulator [Bacteroidetes bacterium]|nr:MAG: response regulator [Bacteroidota bacterium]